MSETRRYSALVFRQREDAPLQAAFIAPSTEIDGWARVPTKRTGNIRNFQRLEIARHISEVTEFFKNPQNASPTAIVIGFDPLRAQGKVRLLTPEGAELHSEAIGTEPVQAAIEILSPSAPPVVQSRDEMISWILDRKAAITDVVFRELVDIIKVDRSQLAIITSEFEKSANEGRSAITLDEPLDSEDALADSDEQSDSESDTSEDDDDLADVPARVAAIIAGLSPSERQVLLGRMSFLAKLQKEYLSVALDDKQLHELLGEILDELKPGLLIDGQHRVRGSRRLGDIPFLVCAMPAAQWPELAFQFIVTNRTAKKVQESLLISIVGNSLSKRQRADIEERLRDAGIRVGLIEAVMRVHEDDASPFFGMLEFGLAGEAGFIEAAAFRGKVVKLWYERRRPVRELFDHFCEGRTSSERTDYWKTQELWFDFFELFWNTVRERYQGSQVFSRETNQRGEPVSKLMTATVLMVFQETILRDILEHLQRKEAYEDTPIAKVLESMTEFKAILSRSLQRIEPEFFQGWKLTGFDGSKDTRNALALSISELAKGEKRLSQLKTDSKLFLG